MQLLHLVGYLHCCTKMRVFVFSTVLSEAFLIARRIQRDIAINVQRALITRYACYTFIKIEFSRPHCWKKSNTKFNENPSRDSRVFPCKLTDGHNEGNGRFSQFAKAHNQNQSLPPSEHSQPVLQNQSVTAV